MVCDGSALGADWHLDYVAVTNTASGAHAKFPYGDWFDSKNGWSHMLSPEGQASNTVRAALGAAFEGGCNLIDTLKKINLHQRLARAGSRGAGVQHGACGFGCHPGRGKLF